ncbi:hypothetical protein Hanom_Chr02g00114361 [Helianthus anomalus]
MAKWRKKQEKTSKKRKDSDEEDATYEPSGAEFQKIKKGQGRLKRMSQPVNSIKKKKARKSTVKTIKVTIAGEPIQHETERVETSEAEHIEIPIQTPPRSLIQQSVHIQTEEVHQTPPQQHQKVQEPGSTTKKTSTTRHSQHPREFNQSFGDIPLGSGPVNLEDIPDMPFFDDGKTKAVEVRVSKLEKEKVASDEKLKNLEAQNDVLKNEVQALNEKVTSLEAGNVALNEVVQGLVTTNEQLSTSNTILSSENGILKKMVNDHEADK